MKVNTWMPLYVADYLTDTRRLSTVQHGAYMLLLMEYWHTAEPLPDDDAVLAKVTQLSPEEWQTHRSVISRFFAVGEGVWRHKRVEVELLKATANKTAKSEAGKKGASKRWHDSANGKPNGEAMAEPLANGCRTDSPSPSPSPIDQRERDGPVEPLSSFPKSEAEAKRAAASIGCPEDFAASTWAKAMSRGGRDAKDVLIRSWPFYLTTEWGYERNRQGKVSTVTDAPASPATVPVWKRIKTTEQEIEQVNKELRAISQSAPTVFPDRAAEEERRRKPLRERKSKLVEQLTELKAKEAGAA